MKELLTSATDYLREKGQGALRRLVAQVPFLIAVTAMCVLAVIWGLHETHLLLVKSGVGGATMSVRAGGRSRLAKAPPSGGVRFGRWYGRSSFLR